MARVLLEFYWMGCHLNECFLVELCLSISFPVTPPAFFPSRNAWRFFLIAFSLCY